MFDFPKVPLPTHVPDAYRHGRGFTVDPGISRQAQHGAAAPLWSSSWCML